jgi:hypothetical protein
MKAVVLLIDPQRQHSWKYDVAKNYTQLNFDYCMADRVGDSDYSFYETDDYRKIPMENYEYLIILNPGIVFEYSYWESSVRKQVEECDAGLISFDNENIAVVKPGKTGEAKIQLDRHYPFIDATNDDTFALTHSGVMATLTHNSNISYIIHNEIPKPEKLHDHLDFAMTVSSGFYINYVLNLSTFDKKTRIHHMDVSPMSLYVREYTIKNWDGHDYYAWMDHIYEKFPMLELYNGKNRLHSHHKAARRCWDHVIETFGDEGWIEHWQKYQQCKHTFNHVNFSDNDLLNKTLKKLKLNGNGAFWWNGALKRLPANIMKTSDQSFENSRLFVNTLNTYNPDLAVYGNDHCKNEFNGISVSKALISMGENSRKSLWKRF